MSKYTIVAAHPRSIAILGKSPKTIRVTPVIAWDIDDTEVEAITVHGRVREFHAIGTPIIDGSGDTIMVISIPSIKDDGPQADNEIFATVEAYVEWLDARNKPEGEVDAETETETSHEGAPEEEEPKPTGRKRRKKRKADTDNFETQSGEDEQEVAADTGSDSDETEEAESDAEVNIEWDTKAYKSKSYWHYTDTNFDFIFIVAPDDLHPASDGFCNKVTRVEYAALKKKVMESDYKDLMLPADDEFSDEDDMIADLL